MAAQPFVYRGLHRLPCLGNRQVIEGDHVPRRLGQEDALLQSNRPVYQVEIEVIEFQVRQRLLECRLYVLRRVGIIP